MTALAAGGDWGRVTETPGEGTADAVAGTPNLLLRARPFRPLIVEPQYLTIRGVGLGFGPYTLRVALAEVCPLSSHTLMALCSPPIHLFSPPCARLRNLAHLASC